MSQQFLSKYFKPVGDSKNGNADEGTKRIPAKNRGSLRGAAKRRKAEGKSSPLHGGSGMRIKETKRKVLSSGEDAEKSRNAEEDRVWVCPHCTFCNDSTAVCSMCAHRRSGLNPDNLMKPEVEIVSSDGDDNARESVKESGDDSDSEDILIGQQRKRAKPSAPLEGSREPKASLNSTSRIYGDGNEASPRVSEVKEVEDDPSVGVLGGNSRRGVESGNQKDMEIERPDSFADSSCMAIARSGTLQPQASVSDGIITADCFKLEEDLRRRKEFQAGIEAASQDSAEVAQGVDATHGQGNDDDSRYESKDQGTNGSGASNRTRKASTSRGKDKGKSGAGGVKLTPMEQQVSDLKQQHPGVLLLVECGYRYRFFGEDALAAAKVLRIYAHMDHNFHVASVPTYRLPVHLRRLVDAGYKVGVVRQAESAALKAAGLTESGKKSGTFKRELTAVFSQATWVEGAVEALMPASASNNGGTGGAGGGKAGGGGGGNGGGQGSWRKVGGTWRRIGGWGGGRRGGDAGGGGIEGRDGGHADGNTNEAMAENDMEALLPKVDQDRSEQWLLSVYEEDTEGDGGEPVSIALALHDEGRRNGRHCSDQGEDDTSGSFQGDKEPKLDSVRVGVVAVDVRTGRVIHDTFLETLGQRRELDTRLRHLRPLELLAPGLRLSKATELTLRRYCQSAVDGRGDKRVVRTERVAPEEFCFDAAQMSLTDYYGNGKGRDKPITTEGTITARSAGALALTRVLDLPRPVICALGPLVAHLQRFGLDRALVSPDLVSFSQSQYMTLDAVTLRDLEILECQVDGREAGSLFSLLNRTQTAFGRRVLAGWVRQPLVSTADIIARQEAVEELATDPPAVIDRLRPTLRDLKDLDPAIASLHNRRIQPSRLFSLLGTMRKVFAVFYPPNGMGLIDPARGEPGGTKCAGGEYRSSRSAVLLEALDSIPANMASVIARYLEDLDAEAAASNDYVCALVDGESLCSELAVAAKAEEAAKTGLHKELQSIRNKIRKPSLQWKTLRTGITSTIEYLVELRKSEAKKLAPDSWMQVSQTKDLVRFHTPEVLSLQQEMLRARESRDIAARQAWAAFVAQVDGACYQGLRDAVHALGTLDALLSLAAVAKLPGYVRPLYRLSSSTNPEDASAEGVRHVGGDARQGNDTGVDLDAIELRGARHPTVERVLEGGFVPNDVHLRRGECLVVTGPNMGGKSSTVRMVALICILGQIGSFVPADSAELYCLDGIYTRMGAGDDLAADMSTFMVELWHTSYILKHATRRSLVILDELGRGTSTHDGVAIALATLRHVVRDLGCATLFVTHYPQVADLALDKSLSGNVKNAHMSFIENPETATEPSAKHGVDNEEEHGDTGAKHPARAKSVTFLYRLVVGQAHQSYGLNVARAAGMDEDMIQLAAQKSAEMRSRSNNG